MAFPSAARLPRGGVGNAARLDGEAWVGRACRAGGALPEAASPADPVAGGRIAGIARGVADSWRSEHWGYTWKGWAYMRIHFGAQEAAAE